MCAYDYDDGSYWEFYTETNPKAKKEHKCDECRRIIKPGEVYKKHSGKWEGGMFTHKMCAHCIVASQLLIRECKGYVFDGIFDDLKEHIGYNYPWERDARRLTNGMRKKWMFNGKLMNVPVLKTSGENNV